MTDKFKPVPNVPKTYEQFVLEEANSVNQQDLYPELGYGDISNQEGYGPCFEYNPNCQCSVEELERQRRAMENWALQGQAQRRIDISISTNGWFYTDSTDTMALMEGMQNVLMGGHATLSGSREYKAKTLRIRSMSNYHAILNDWNRSGAKSLQIVGEFWRNSNPRGVHSTFANRLSEIKRILDNPRENAERSFYANY